MSEMIKEACVGNLKQAIAAEIQGADRVELCSRLDLDGLTPSFELISQCLSHLNIPIKVMIRPREGDFVYNKEELTTMINSINKCKKLGIREIVIGVLKNDNTVDVSTMKILAEQSFPMTITFHKAIDMTPQPLNEIRKLKKIENIKAILSSGKSPTAYEGKDMLCSMKKECKGNMELIVAGKVTDQNINLLHKYIGSSAYHGKQIVGKLK